MSFGILPVSVGVLFLSQTHCVPKVLGPGWHPGPPFKPLVWWAKGCWPEVPLFLPVLSLGWSGVPTVWDILLLSFYLLLALLYPFEWARVTLSLPYWVCFFLHSKGELSLYSSRFWSLVCRWCRQLVWVCHPPPESWGLHPSMALALGLPPSQYWPDPHRYLVASVSALLNINYFSTTAIATYVMAPCRISAHILGRILVRHCFLVGWPLGLSQMFGFCFIVTTCSLGI